jgi:predicted DNA-binding transcriptional regulator AlpA
MSHWREFLDPDARGGRYLPWREVAKETGLSRTTAWRLQQRDDFPAPYAISPGRVAYREQELEAWRVSRDRRAAPSPMHHSKIGPVPPSARRHAPRQAAERSASPSLAAEPAQSMQAATAGSPERGAVAAMRRTPRRPRSDAAHEQMLFDF